jgi:hypothetical protein
MRLLIGNKYQRLSIKPIPSQYLQNNSNPFRACLPRLAGTETKVIGGELNRKKKNNIKR